MEAVPRMSMISFELKHSPEYVEFGPTLKKYIRDHYGEDPAQYNKSCTELEAMRQTAVQVSHDFMGCSTLKKYYSQLQFLQARFPMTEGGEAAIPFTWEEVHSGREYSLNDIKFEQASILYNIGALHSILGAMDTRQSADGMKVSCTHFQCASWAFEHLRDHFGSAGMSLDMAHEILTFQVFLMLAQAQECILEKSMTDSRKSTITAKVAAQIVDFYNTTLKHLDSCNSLELISSKRYKEWKRRIDVKVLFYTCITHYYMGRQSEEQQKWGQCLAYYTLALNKLTECEKLAKNESDDIQDALRFTHDVVGGKHQAAKKDNDFVYHDKVPELDSLPEVKGASLVKGIPFNPSDPEVSGPDIFSKLVPMSAHETASLYSEEKATLLRRIASEIAEKNEELTQYLASLQLDQTSLNPEPERLPQQLLEKCAALSVRPTAIRDLVDSMTAVSNVSTDVELGIQEIQEKLQEESRLELEYQEVFGKRSPNAALSEIAQECGRLEEGHRKGSQSNRTLHAAMNTHINNLKLLSSPLEDLQKLLPSIDKERDPESSDVIKQLNSLLSKIEEMRTQRQTLEEQLRKSILEDDITAVLCKKESFNKESLFSEQLKKHEKTTSLIRQNLSAQNNILRALTDANAKYASVRRATSEALAKREQTIRDLINSYDVYEDLQSKSQKGLEFYRKLATNVERLRMRCLSVCKVQEEERKKMYDKIKPKAPAVSSAPPPEGVRNQAPRSSPTPGRSDTPDSGYPGLPADTHFPPMGNVFDGPKLKDYLPFMKPKTFGKKDGSPPVTGAHPSVQDYLAGSRLHDSQTGSLPSSGTASPVHLPRGPESVPASPEHFRQRFDGRLGPSDPPRVLPRQPGPDLTQGHSDMYPYPNPTARGQQGMIPDERSANYGDEFNNYQQYMNNLSKGQTFRDQGSIPSGQSQLPLNQTRPPTSSSEYVPLDQKWKKENQMQSAQFAEQTPAQFLQSQGQYLGDQGQYSVQSVVPQHSLRHKQAHPLPARSDAVNYAGNVTFPEQGQPMQQGQGYIYSDRFGQNVPLAVENAYNNNSTQQQIGSIPSNNVTAYGYMPGQQGSLPNQTNQRNDTNTWSQVGGPITASGNDGRVYTASPNISLQANPRDSNGQVGSMQTLPPQPAHVSQAYPGSTAQAIPSSGSTPFQPAALSNVQQPGQQSAWQQPMYHGQGQNINQTQIHHQNHQNVPQQLPMQGAQFPNPIYSSQSVGPAPGNQPHYRPATPQPQQQVGQLGQTGFPAMSQPSVSQTVTPYGQPSVTGPISQPSGSQTVTPYGQPVFTGPMSQPSGSQTVTPYGQPVFTGTMSQPSVSQTVTSYGQPVFTGPMYQPSGSQTVTPYGQPSVTVPISHHSGSQAVTPQSQHAFTGTISVGSAKPEGLNEQQSQQAQNYPPQQQWQQQLHQQQQQIPQQQILQNQMVPQQPQHQSSVIPSGNQISGHLGTGMASVPGGQHGSPFHSQGQGPIPQSTNMMPTAAPFQQMSSQIPQDSYQNPNAAMQQRPQQIAPVQAQGPTAGILQGQGHMTRPPVPNYQDTNTNRQLTQGTIQTGQAMSVQQGPSGQANMHIGQAFQPQGPAQGHVQQGGHGQIAQGSQGYGVPTSGQLTVTGASTFQQTVLPPMPAVSQGNIQIGAQGHIQPVFHNAPQGPIGKGQGYPQATYQDTSGISRSSTPLTQFQPAQQASFPTQQTTFRSTQPGQTYNNSYQAQQYGPLGQVSQQPSSGPHPLQPQSQVPVSFSTSINQPLLQPQVLRTASPSPAQGQGQIHPPAQQPQVTSRVEGQYNSQTSFGGPNVVDTRTVVQVAGPRSLPSAVSAAVTRVTMPTGSRSDSPVIVHRQMSQPSMPIPQIPVDRKLDGVKIPVDRKLSTASSLDDILSSSPGTRAPSSEDVLAPKIMTAQDLQQQKEDQMKAASQEIRPTDPYKGQSKRQKFVEEVEKLAKFIEGFEKPSCSGPTPLDTIWKDLMEEQERACKQQKLAIARCYPMKNRDQDIMPYDNSRVLLTTLKDDYINASWVNDLSPTCPKFIATQAPLPVTLTDFWLMVCEQGVEVLVALSSDIETGKKFPVYIPLEKGETVEHGPVQLTVQSVKQKSGWTERILHLRHHETNTGRTLVHLHYNCWPVSGFPEKKSHLLQFITEVHSFYRQQRSLMKPIVVHCGNGVGRTGMFQLIYVGMQEINQGHGILNVPEVAGKMLWKRRHLILKQDQLKSCYETILYYAQDVLAKEGILVNKASFGDQLPKPGTKVQGWEPGEDILFGSLSFTNLQSNVAKLGTSKHDSASLDQKLAALKNGFDGSSENTSSKMEVKAVDQGVSEKIEVEQMISMLPDVVQNPGLSLERKNDKKGSIEEESKKIKSGLEDRTKNIMSDLDSLVFDQKKSKSPSLKSAESFDSKGSKPSSVTASPAHARRDLSHGSPSRGLSQSPKPEILSSSLTELQDPSKFSIGTNEGSKRKIKKSDFTDERRPPPEKDPNDPFSSLDPFWKA
ncbi:tyrosine-protein phosphatase non-receptor type 23-like isoform X2 [Dreissena polymorpha]|uniref:tyrosine-protein phosphatase non-receptor type 23-like isoform X2 n=1 Tax=Dreissena polymorpha TaxID=45954 RepID=UPI0022645DD1|nr:tyrosine-protein phosphatase non-receptor type 23-like isoform X2 [Dreissena polymorpha]